MTDDEKEFLKNELQKVHLEKLQGCVDEIIRLSGRVKELEKKLEAWERPGQVKVLESP